jgi:GNAT superfamily N-acetyltransferase
MPAERGCKSHLYRMSIMKTVLAKTIYLEMLAPPEQVVPPPIEGVEVVWEKKPKIPFYRNLYDLVGRDWHWLERKRLTDDELRDIIHQERVEIHVLYVNGEPAGFGELHLLTDEQVQLYYFGLVPKFIGQGLGKYFLNSIVRKAWSSAPKRVWVHTCEFDHKAALPTYLKAGFVVFDEKMIDHGIA